MPVCAVVIQKTSGLSLRCGCWRCCDPVCAHVVVGICHGDTNHGSTCCSGGECPSDLQHCLGLFLSCPPFLVLLNPLGQPRALCCPAAEGVGKAFMPVRDIWFVECQWQVVKERRMRRGSFVLQHLSALLSGLGAFLGLGFLNSGYSVRKHPFPPW